MVTVGVLLFSLVLREFGAVGTGAGSEVCSVFLLLKEQSPCSKTYRLPSRLLWQEPLPWGAWPGTCLPFSC